VFATGRKALSYRSDFGASRDRGSRTHTSRRRSSRSSSGRP